MEIKYKTEIKCLNYENKFTLISHYNQKFCSVVCEKKYKIIEKYRDYLEHQKDYCYVRNMHFVKKHILIEQNNHCAICPTLNIWNNKPIIFVLDHIDGDASNNLRINLRLVCPNCDSQLDTYKSKNKNSARKERYLLNYKNGPVV